MKLFQKIQKAWLFSVANPVVRKGEHGGFKWTFRRFWLDIESVSGNFKARFIAGEHPYGYLLAGKTDDNIIGFCKIIYSVGMTLTTDQKFVNDVEMAIVNYNQRLEGLAEIKEDPTEEKIAIEEVKQVQEYVEASPKEKRTMERDSNGRFKKKVKQVLKEDEKD